MNFKEIKLKQLLSMFLLLFSVVSSIYADEQFKKFGRGKVVFPMQNLTIEVEVATTTMQRTIGLMFRERLGQNKGMLFDFKEQAVQQVWMKNTLIPLDVVFISDKGKIVSILKELVPCTKEPCAIYDSIKRVRYMLEINTGMIEKEKIEIGQGVLFFL